MEAGADVEEAEECVLVDDALVEDELGADE